LLVSLDDPPEVRSRTAIDLEAMQGDQRRFDTFPVLTVLGDRRV
jgi:hypothetical protein